MIIVKTPKTIQSHTLTDILCALSSSDLSRHLNRHVKVTCVGVDLFKVEFEFHDPFAFLIESSLTTGVLSEWKDILVYKCGCIDKPIFPKNILRCCECYNEVKENKPCEYCKKVNYESLAIGVIIVITVLIVNWAFFIYIGEANA
jgi:hypothetical protein